MVENQIDKSILSEWWQQVDKVLLIGLFLLISVGFLLSFTISPKSSLDLNSSLSLIFSKQSIYLLLGLSLSLFISFYKTENFKNIIIPLFIFSLMLLVSTLFFGYEMKGSQRWLNFRYFTLMPIEFVKPFFCLFLAKILENNSGKENFYKYGFSFLSYIIIASILVLQPDISQLFLISSIYIACVFMSGFSFFILCIIIFFGLFGFTLIYFFNFNVQSRINSFIFSENYENMQADLSINAINTGGLFGVGPGEGTLKNILPESHTDYIFAVIAEEFGIIGCMILLGIFLMIAYRVFKRIYNEKNHFLQISLFSLVIYFSLQALVHISVNLNLIPSTGMTLPFISYGGSSIIGISITFGLIMLLSKKRHI